MNIYARTARIEALRQRAISASKTHVMDQDRERREDGRYGWDDRQLLHFYEAWLRHADEKTVLLRRALAEADMIAQEPVIFRDDDLIIGQPDVTLPSKEESARLKQLRDPYLDYVPQVMGRTGHMALDYEKLLKVGITGLLEEIEERRAALDKKDLQAYLEKEEFYRSCQVQLEALLTLQDRYLEEARRRGNAEQIALLERVPRYPARTFHEALQSMHFYSFILRDLFSCGRPDQYLIDYYRADLEKGILTEERAMELIDCFNLQYTFYTRPVASISYMLGGHTPDGEVVENELTWLFLQSISHVQLPYPGVGLAVSKDTSDEMLDYALELLSKGYTHPAIYNDDMIAEELRKVGVAPRDAWSYVHSTCVEITTCYTSGSWGTSPYISCPEILMKLLKNRQDFSDTEALYEAFCQELEQVAYDSWLEQNMLQLERRRNGGESPLASCLVNDCLATGKGLDQGGARYNHILPDYVGVSNTLDSFAAIHQVVFTEKKLTLSQFVAILEDNYEGNEALRQYILHRCRHFGNNDQMDEGAAKFYEKLLDVWSPYETFRGGRFIPGAFSFDMHRTMGAECMATPDGRKCAEAFNAGADPVSGRDVNGPTATILSDTAWNQGPFLGGVVINLRLNTGNYDDRKRKAFNALVRVFLERGGMELQVNTVSPALLEQALAEPEKYEDLVVRVGGFSDFFVRQNPALQREILARSYGEL